MREAKPVEPDSDDDSSSYEEEESQQEEDFQDEEQANGKSSFRPQLDDQLSPSKREINPNFKDVHETGKWGSVSKKEIYIVLGLIIAIVIGVIVVVVVLVTGKDDGEGTLITNPPQPPPVTSPPTIAPTKAPTDVVLATVREAIAQQPSIASSLDTLPDLASDYEGISDNTDFPPNARAMSWLLYQDPMQPGPGNPELVTRYAAATLYYSTGGPTTWTNRGLWLEGDSICDWNGLFCDVFTGHMKEISLRSNNLGGQLPNELALFQDMEALDVRRNAITGPLPGLALSELPRLTILYVDNNQFTGSIPSILGEGNLSIFFSQNNNFTRSFFPSTFCGDDGLNLKQAGLSCRVTTCLCCKRELHCF